MSYQSNVTSADMLFAGEDKTLSYEVFSDEDSLDVMEDVSAWTMQWELRPIVIGKHPYRTQGETVFLKTTAEGGGITITGIYNPARALNTQRVIVAIADTDTLAVAGGRYVCALKRMNDGVEAVLSHGTVELLVASVR